MADIKENYLCDLEVEGLRERERETERERERERERVGNEANK